MNYYEELGLRETATTQDIRHAYKVFARLVHPDGQADPQVRIMAERQMTRLNEILSTLVNPEKRRAYDERLRVGVRPASLTVAGPDRRRAPISPEGSLRVQLDLWWAGLPEWAQSGMRYWYWISLAVVMLCVGVWYVAEAGPPTPAAQMRPVETPLVQVGPRLPKPPGARGRATHDMPAVSTDAVGSQPAAGVPDPPGTEGPAGEVSHAIDPAHPQAAGSERAESPSLAVEPAPADARNPGSSASFAGSWLYVPETDKPQPGTYPATYIELLLAEDQGALSGRYRAQYKVADLAVSPEVSFRATGKATDAMSARLNWTSPTGARGEVEITLLGRNRMNLTWWTTDIGRRATLASGTAKLIRQQVP